MTEAEEQALADAGKRWGYWNQRRWLSTDQLLLLANQQKDGAAHFELSLRYELGIDVSIDRNRALSHMEQAAEKIGAARMRLVTEYLDGGTLVEKNPAEHMKRLQEAADIGIFAALEQLAELKRAGRRAQDCSAEDLTEIEGLYARAESYYRAGSMYCSVGDPSPCSDEEVSKAKEWFRRGLNSNSAHDCPKCVEALSILGERGGTRAVDKSLGTAELLFAPFVLLIWAIIGTALLGFALSITAVTLPLVIGLSVVAAIYRAFKR